MRVDALMSTPVVTVDADDRLATLRELFQQTGFHHLVVMDAGQVRGIISDRDLLAAISPNIGTPAETAKDLATLNKLAHQIMSRALVTLCPDEDLQTAIQRLNEHRVSGLPVINDKNQPLGILTWRDVLRQAEKSGFNGD
ncbi:CBS domain-containing protein [Spongiibacter tropicus]|uniref:CBS domain-containing protein n=1 Tax=Spongiibacter tropicus TaxID=454602 RepID=UPI0003B6CFAD|nr:CBS domain-containing protein [Spongiibacter tropicus]